uniref:RNA-directed DNA polymerase n=1 Tax=Schizaphis graminum TaxID=13262 RepID=A0A2S2NVX6_SCHGA
MFRKEAACTELHTKASTFGLGAMLLQSSVEGDPLKLVYCASRKTSDAETRYHSSKLELLCVVWAVNKLRQFLLGIKFTVLTDCQALTYLNSSKSVNAQVARWYDALQEYDFEVKYRPGVRMAHVDALSRAPVGGEESLDEALTERQTVCVLITLDERVMMCQTADGDVAHIKRIVEESPEEGLGLSYVVKDQFLYRRFRDKLLFVIPKSMRKSLVVTAHDLSGHPAVDRMMANVLQDFWFPNMRRYVKLHIRSCFECLLTRVPRGKRPGLLHPIPVGKRPFGTVHIDHVGPFIMAPGGLRYILVMVDNLTKYVTLYAVPNTKSEPLIKSIQHFVKEYGLPGRLITDRGTCYTSGAFEDFCAAQGIKLVWTSSRHPQANGQVERIHNVVMAALMTMGGAGSEWAKMLPEVQRLLNNSETKVMGKTPFEILHGYRPRFEHGALLALSTTKDDWTPPEKLQAFVQVNMELEKTKKKAAYDNIHYSVGEVVIMRRAPNCTGESTKMQDRYKRPLVVTEVLSSDVYSVTELDTTKGSRFATTAHVSQLKSWRLPADVDAEEELSGSELPAIDKEEGELGETRTGLPDKEDLPEPEPQQSCSAAPDDRRSQRVVRRPGWMRDYTW